MTDFAAAMRKATYLTRSYNLMEATRVIQDALTGGRTERCDDPAPQLAPLALPAPAASQGAGSGEPEVDPAAAPGEVAIDVGSSTAAAKPSLRERRPLG